MRALCAIQISHPEKLTSAFDALYKGMWIDNKAVHKPDVFAPVLASVVGGDGDHEVAAREVLQKSTEKEAKDLLIRNTDLALDEGAFGLPWFVGMCVVCSFCFVFLSCFLFRFYWLLLFLRRVFQLINPPEAGYEAMISE